MGTKLNSQWFECDDGNIPISDHEDKHFSADNYIFVGVRLDETDGVRQRCSICGDSFSSLPKHLQRSKLSCSRFFDLEALKKEKALKSDEKRKVTQKKARENPVYKKLANDQNAASMRKARADAVKKKLENDR